MLGHGAAFRWRQRLRVRLHNDSLANVLEAPISGDKKGKTKRKEGNAKKEYTNGASKYCSTEVEGQD